MKLILVAALLALAAARPQEAEYDPTAELREAGILGMDMSMSDDGSFQYAYETTDPASQDVAGQQKQIGEQSGTVYQGRYSFVADDGQEYTVTYTADENGVQASGAHLPVAPEDPNRAAQEQAYADALARQ